MSKSLLAQIDARAAKLGITRSQYFAQLARNDLIDGGDLTLKEDPGVGAQLAHKTGKTVAYKISRGKKETT